MKTITKPHNHVYYISILKPGCGGQYDIVLDYHCETISDRRYVKGYIIQNTNNKDYGKTSNILFASPSYEYTGKKYNIMHLFGDDLIKGE